jgi:hypothetical protein
MSDELRDSDYRDLITVSFRLSLLWVVLACCKSAADITEPGAKRLHGHSQHVRTERRSFSRNVRAVASLLVL